MVVRHSNRFKHTSHSLSFPSFLSFLLVFSIVTFERFCYKYLFCLRKKLVCHLLSLYLCQAVHFMRGGERYKLEGNVFNSYKNKQTKKNQTTVKHVVYKSVLSREILIKALSCCKRINLEYSWNIKITSFFN